MIDYMKNDMMYLKEDLELDEEEEIEWGMKEESKHETAVITPELIEKSKQERIKNEESKKQTLQEESDEEEREDFSDDILSKIQKTAANSTDGDLSETFGDFDQPAIIIKKEPEKPKDDNIFGAQTWEPAWDQTANFNGAFC